MDKITSKNKELMKSKLERCADTNLLCDCVILSRSDSPRKVENRVNLLLNPANFNSISFRQHTYCSTT